jgi:hypothetical protein
MTDGERNDRAGHKAVRVSLLTCDLIPATALARSSLRGLSVAFLRQASELVQARIQA